jgi:hypothetical protein
LSFCLESALTVILLFLLPILSWDYRCTPSYLACLLRWGLANFLPGLASNLILPISDSPVTGITGVCYHAWPGFLPPSFLSFPPSSLPLSLLPFFTKLMQAFKGLQIRSSDSSQQAAALWSITLSVL